MLTEKEKTIQLGKVLLREGYAVKLTVGGTSMFPSVRSRQVVKVIPADPRNLFAGDIVVFERGGQLIAHRLISLNKMQHTFITKGDFTIRRDPVLCEEDILGKIDAIYRGNKLISLDRPIHKIKGRLMARITRIMPPVVWLVSHLKRWRYSK